MDTFKTLLSIGPTFAIMNFLESKPLIMQCALLPRFSIFFALIHITLRLYLLIVFNGVRLLVLGALDVLLMFGAYKTARWMARSRLVIRFLWTGLSSAFVLYIYL